ncbi:MAG: SUMF1/EgtB/PvdO family nonheme iron enzyme, partial [Anaerolineae bacterium]|nr:SUMF1/EgtB/PvdO family nonheme iron enzyme [Anaerolineae bacterium]
SGAEDEEAADREKPLHQVDIPYGYWLGQYSVTVAQWQAFVAASGHRPVDADSLRGVGNEPVVYVTWHEAVAFCGWLTTAWRQAGWLPAGGEVRLPSEAEWEKGARGGVAIAATPLICLASNLAEPTAAAVSANLLPQRRFPWGEERTQEAANGETSGVGTTTAVGGFPAGASPYGALDMS